MKIKVSAAQYGATRHSPADNKWQKTATLTL